MTQRRLTIDMFPGGLDDRMLRVGDIVDKNIVCSCIGTLGSDFERYIRETENGVLIVQNPHPYTERYIGGENVCHKLYHTFVKGGEYGQNWRYMGMCMSGQTMNADAKHGERIFVVSRYAGDTEKNIEFARKVCAWLVTMQGAVPIAPHLLFPQFMNDEDEVERDIGIDMGHVLMEYCDSVLVALRYNEEYSPGMKADVEYAAQLGIPIVERRF